ncbi:hypothetical protein LG201_06395 [Methylobacillus gramineus]|uniref:DUF7931 domain-containing protein n=1 Tax=Methylobacillus gramineus TaxID=755169 RepID=UPI001CFF699A|nr:hypothetical protein [Methylobacillus gramineus]MCB5184829.1 hypothetical protein [Methylobacillus gramineus]
MNGLPENQILQGEMDYEHTLDCMLGRAASSLLMFDIDLRSGNYTSMARYQQLHDFLTNNVHSTLTMVLHDTGYLELQCFRLCKLMQQYGHRMMVYQTSNQARAAMDPFIVADHIHYVRRFHVDHARFKYAFNDLDASHILTRRFAELLESATHRFTLTRLGL